MEKIVTLIQEGNLECSVAKDVDWYQGAVLKIGCIFKRKGVVKKGKHTGRPGKTSKCRNRKLKAISPKKRNYTKQMNNKRVK